MSEREARCMEQTANAARSELVTVLGMDSLAGRKLQREGGAGGVGRNVDLLGDGGDQVHLDAGFGGVPARLVLEVLRMEVGAELAVQAYEDVTIECRGCS